MSPPVSTSIYFRIFSVSPLMTNSADTAAHWTKFIAECPEFVAGEALLAQFSAGKITRLCECGCNSFDMVLEEGRQTAPIVPPSGRGHAVFLAEFPTKQPPGASLEFIVYADAKGNFDGLDVHLNGNTEPIPEKLAVSEAPCHAYGILARKG